MIHELRHYVPAEGKAEALARRMKDHFLPWLAVRGLTMLDYWEAADGSGEIWYLMEWRDETAMAEGWGRWRTDPVWIAAKNASETDGPLVARTRSIVLRRPAYYRR